MENGFNHRSGMATEMQIGEVKDRTPFHAKRIILLLGKKSRSGASDEAEIRAALAERGVAVLNDEAAPEGRALKAVIERHGNDADAILVGGGDGSVNEVLPYLVETKLPLCLLPRGTANNLARTLNIPTKVSKALDLLNGQGEETSIDLGLANGRYFVNVAGIGLSARINASTPGHWKKRFGPLAFVISAAKLAHSMVPFHVDLECDGEFHRVRSLQLTIVNGKYFGNGLCVSPDHSLHDHLLAAVSIRVRRWWEALVLIPSFLSGGVKTSPKVLVVSGSRIRVTTRRPMRVDLDGDIRTQTPLDISVVPCAARIVCPFPTVEAAKKIAEQEGSAEPLAGTG